MKRVATSARQAIFASFTAAAIASVATEASASDNFVLFESGQVRPLALSPSGSRLFAVNTPDNRLEVFHVLPGRLIHVDSVPVGLEPVAVAARNEHEVWVVNHLSDSISIVDVGLRSRVTRTLLVGDEPRDVVFAGPGRNRAFVTVAHRGQNIPFNPQLTTPAVGRADVWVYNANNLGNDVNGGPISIINLFTDTPRALTVTPDGKKVYAAGFNSGNRTTIINEFLPFPFVPELLQPPPFTNFEGVPVIKTGFMVRFNGAHWVDEIGRPWDQFVNFNLPDKDVFVIDAMANPPRELPGTAFSGVGTTLYGMVVNPKNGKVYVSNTEAANDTRFEGPGTFAGHTVRGQHNQNRITVLQSGAALPRNLNKHIDFSSCCAPVPNAENARSVALPTGLAVSSNGNTLYAAMLGTSEVGIYSTAQIENDSFVPNVNDQVKVSGGGPTGLVLDENRRQLFVLTRFDNSISVINTQTRREVAHVSMFNPEPPSVTRGRRFLYDATLSSHGDSACATCHVFGDKDDLTWDLGNPDASPEPVLNPFGINLVPGNPVFPPMKGPMSTQSLRGMSNHGPMHWRGDRTAASFEPSVQPDSGAFNERENFIQFQKGFVDLLGTPGPIPDADMAAFADFILQVMYPPNPVKNLDDSDTPDQAFGRDFFMNRRSEAAMGPNATPENPIDPVRCDDCHRLDPDGNREFGVKFPGFFGSSNLMAFEVFPQPFKVPHLRNLYTKIGMFGFPNLAPVIEAIPDQLGHMGDQIRGFGVSRAGDIDHVFRFLHVTQFSKAFLFAPPGSNPGGFDPGVAGTEERRKVEAFLLAFDSNHKPIVGQQFTLTDRNGSVANPRVDLLVARADAGDCELVAKGRIGPLGLRERGFLYLGGGQFMTDRASESAVSADDLRDSVNRNHEALTFTCAPLGTGYRIGVDRDDDGVLDGDDHDLD